MSSTEQRHGEMDEKLGELDEESCSRSVTCPPPSRLKSRAVRFEKYFSVELSTNHADVLLLTCCIISGLVDSTIYNAFGTFVSMQTVITFLFLHLYPKSFSSFLYSEHGSSQEVSRATLYSWPSAVRRPIQLQNPTAGSNHGFPFLASVSAASVSVTLHAFFRHSAA